MSDEPEILYELDKDGNVIEEYEMVMGSGFATPCPFCGDFMIFEDQEDGRCKVWCENPKCDHHEPVYDGPFEEGE
jgi:hypothetical protein